MIQGDKLKCFWATPACSSHPSSMERAACSEKHTCQPCLQHALHRVSAHRSSWPADFGFKTQFWSRTPRWHGLDTSCEDHHWMTTGWPMTAPAVPLLSLRLGGCRLWSFLASRYTAKKKIATDDACTPTIPNWPWRFMTYCINCIMLNREDHGLHISFHEILNDWIWGCNFWDKPRCYRMSRCLQ